MLEKIDWMIWCFLILKLMGLNPDLLSNTAVIIINIVCSKFSKKFSVIIF